MVNFIWSFTFNLTSILMNNNFIWCRQTEWFLLRERWCTIVQMVLGGIPTSAITTGVFWQRIRSTSSPNSNHQENEILPSHKPSMASTPINTTRVAPINLSTILVMDQEEIIMLDQHREATAYPSSGEIKLISSSRALSEGINPSPR